MISTLKRMVQAAAFAIVAASAGPALAAEPTGIWIDHTGRGAVEITKCGSQLCGSIVWLKDNQNHRQACGLKVIGEVKPVKGGVWDGGWIYDPEEDARYSVEITPVGANSLKIVGYLGSKLFSETMMWQRAPADLKRCDA